MDTDPSEAGQKLPLMVNFENASISRIGWAICAVNFVWMPPFFGGAVGVARVVAGFYEQWNSQRKGESNMNERADSTGHNAVAYPVTCKNSRKI